MSRTDLEDLRIVRVLPDDLERVLAGSRRMNDRTKVWAREYFLDRMSCNDIASAHGVEPQHVASKIRAVRAKLAAQASPLQYVQVTMSLPMALGKALQTLANELGTRQSLELAETTLLPVLKAIEVARRKLMDSDR